jgi:arabinogalactan endo-1,4-beta-galactosidase
MNPRRCHAIAIAACLLQISAAWLYGRTDQIIYSNSLQNGWTDVNSWATDNPANTNPVLPGFSNSISVFCTEYAALALSQTPSSSAFYTNLTLWLNGGDTGGQVLTVTGTLDGTDQALYTLPPLAANTWQEFTVPLSAIGVANQPDFDGIWIWNYTNTTIPTFYVDDIFLHAGQADPSFLAAADFSFLSYFESLGVQYKDGGVVTDGIQILKNHGINCVRLRLFTSSEAQAANDPYNYINNTNYTVPLAVRVKNAGLLFSLDFHYSDTWADPGHQAIPATWSNLNFPQLVQQMYTYNSNTIATFAAAGAMPDYVQVGNEITSGMLWPYGGPLSGNGGTNWSQLGQLMTNAIQGIQDAASAAGQPMPKIIVHIDRGGDWATTEWFFSNLEAQGVPFDIIGESYYPFYQGSLTALSTCLTNAAITFGKPIVVAETAFPWTNTCPAAWLSDLYGYPPTEIGQVSFIVAEGQVFSSVPNGLATGVFYWGGEYQAVSGVNEAGFNTASFFDAGGNVLPSLNAVVALGAPLTTGPPLAMTLAASGTTATNTTLNAQGYANGAPSTAWFQWGPTASYGNFTTTNTLAANYLAQAVAAAITNLSPSTPYHFQAVVANGAGTNYGGDLTFVTSSLSGPPQPAYLYQEDFGAVAGGGLTLAQVGWIQVPGPSGYGGIYPQANAVDVNTHQSLPTSAADFGGNRSGTGIFYTTNGAGSGTSGDSAFTSIDPTLYSNLTFSVETQQSATGANVSSYFAVQVGGAWYMSTSPMTAYVEGSASPNFSLTSLVYNPNASGWINLTVSSHAVTVGSGASGNLSGPITGIGIVVRVASGGGSWDYNDLLISATAPHIVSQPTNQSVALGGNANFAVGATGAPTLVYQWQFNNTNLPNATNSALGLANVQASNAGPYQVVLGNSYGAITSAVALLGVTGVPTSFYSGPGGLQLSNGQFLFSLTGLTGQGAVVIDGSTNLVQWVPIYTNPSAFGTATIIDSNAGNFQWRFYRAMTPSAP